MCYVLYVCAVILIEHDHMWLCEKLQNILNAGVCVLLYIFTLLAYNVHIINTLAERTFLV